MRITLRQETTLGAANDWRAIGAGLPREGTGFTAADAVWSLVRANLAAFGIDRVDQETLRTAESGQTVRESFRWQAANQSGDTNA
jgi:hypothetical protein